MSSSITVNVESLLAARKRIYELRVDFDAASGHQFVDYGPLGARSLISAFNELDSNWTYKRRKLVDSIQALIDHLDQASKAYQQWDVGLAEALR